MTRYLFSKQTCQLNIFCFKSSCLWGGKMWFMDDFWNGIFNEDPNTIPNFQQLHLVATTEYPAEWCKFVQAPFVTAVQGCCGDGMKAPGKIHVLETAFHFFCNYAIGLQRSTSKPFMKKHIYVLLRCRNMYKQLWSINNHVYIYRHGWKLISAAPPHPTSQKGLCTCSMWSKTIFKRRKDVKICKQRKEWVTISYLFVEKESIV